jgi:hypothetical protein
LKPSLRISLVLVGGALMLGVAVPSVSHGGDDWKKAFNEKFASQNSWERAAGVKSLDPSQPDPMLGVTWLHPVAEHAFRSETKNGFGSNGEPVVFEMGGDGRWSGSGSARTS